MDAADTEIAAADVYVKDDLIAAIGPELRPEPATSVFDGHGKLLMPGLVNAHFHSPGTFNKGAFDSLPLEIFMLYEVPPFDCPPTAPRLNYVRTLLGAVEMLKSGVTAVHDDPFYVPTVNLELVDAVMSAYADSGIRATASINMPNVVEYEKYPFLYELLPATLRNRMENSPRLSGAELLDLYRTFISRWHGAHSGRLAAGVSCSAPQRVTREYLRALADLSAQFELPYTIHILETKLQRVLGEERFGKSLVKYARDEGVLNERVTIVHAIWVDEEDMDAIAAAGCSVAHNPLCNLRLGSGIMPYRALADRRINICLGSDEMCSDDAVNMWSVTKQAALVHTVTDPDYRRRPGAAELLRCATVNGARAMRARNTGTIEVGKQADLVLIDLNTLAFTPLNDLRRQLVFCENGSSVRLVLVAGRIVVEDGRVVTVNEEDLKAEVRELMVGYAAQFGEVAHWATELEPMYRAMYERAAACDVGMSRWVGQ